MSPFQIIFLWLSPHFELFINKCEDYETLLLLEWFDSTHRDKHGWSIPKTIRLLNNILTIHTHTHTRLVKTLVKRGAIPISVCLSHERTSQCLLKARRSFSTVFSPQVSMFTNTSTSVLIRALDRQTLTYFSTRRTFVNNAPSHPLFREAPAVPTTSPHTTAIRIAALTTRSYSLAPTKTFFLCSESLGFLWTRHVATNIDSVYRIKRDRLLYSNSLTIRPGDRPSLCWTLPKLVYAREHVRSDVDRCIHGSCSM